MGRLPANVGASAIVSDPKQPRRVYAAGSAGVFRSDDAGQTWVSAGQGLPPGEVAALAIDPRQPRHLYATTADVYVINSDTTEQSRRLKQPTGISLPVLLDRQLEVARRYDLLPKRGQPMGGVAQMGFVIIDADGTIRVQRVDLNFGQHAGQMLEILRLLG